MDVLGLIFSNIHDENVPELTTLRTMASIPFCGRYRLIDFALSNMVNSGITKVGVITKSNYSSLMDHVVSGKDWDLARRQGGLIILPPFGVQESNALYNTRLEALKTTMGFLSRSTEEYVIMSDSDMVCSMDLQAVMKDHLANNADITMVYVRVNASSLSGTNNILLNLDSNSRVSEMLFDPIVDGEVKLYSNVCVIQRKMLISLIQEAVAHNKHHFGSEVLADNLHRLNIRGYEHSGYYVRISSLQSYYEENMRLLNKDERHSLFGENQIYTKIKDSAPTQYGENSIVKNSLIADGCTIEGEVYNSVLFRGVKVGRGTVIRNSILMQGTITGENAMINCIITDKNVVIRDKRVLSGCENHPFFIGKSIVM